MTRKILRSLLENVDFTPIRKDAMPRRIPPSTEITLDVRLSIRLMGDHGNVDQAELEAYVAAHLLEIRRELAGKVTLRADFWSTYINDSDEICVDDVLNAELIEKAF